MNITAALIKRLLRGDVKRNYTTTIDGIRSIVTGIRDFNQEVKIMADPNSDSYKTWTANLRAGVYSSVGGGTVGMIFADIFGCLGICSLIYNSIGWGTAVPLTENA